MIKIRGCRAGIWAWEVLLARGWEVLGIPCWKRVLSPKILAGRALRGHPVGPAEESRVRWEIHLICTF